MAQAALSLNASSIAAQIAALATKHDNLDTGLERLAIAADKDGRAAFWRTTTYSNAIVSLVVATANASTLAAALAQWSDARHPQKTVDAILARLVPLNAKAVAAMVRATVLTGEREAA